MSRHTCQKTPKMSSNDLTFICKSCKHLFSRRNLYEDPDGLLHCYHCLKAFCNKAAGDRNSNAINSRMMAFHEVPTRKPAKSSQYISKSSARCPKSDCRKFLSPLTIESHIRYEHKEIPIFLTQFGCATSLKFDPMELKYGETRCLLMLNVADLEVPEEKNQRRGKVTFPSSRPAIMLLASKISVDQPARRNRPPIMTPRDRLVLWMASNLPGELRYSLTASTLDGSSEQNFCGTMSGLEQDAEAIMDEGTALCLVHVQVNRMTGKGTRPIVLEVEVRDGM